MHFVGTCLSCYVVIAATDTQSDIKGKSHHRLGRWYWKSHSEHTEDSAEMRDRVTAVFLRLSSPWQIWTGKPLLPPGTYPLTPLTRHLRGFWISGPGATG